MPSQLIPNWPALQKFGLDWRRLQYHLRLIAAKSFPPLHSNPSHPCQSVVRFFLVRAHPRPSAVSPASVFLQSSSALPSAPCAHPSPHSQAVSPSPSLHPTPQTWSCPRSPPLSVWNTRAALPSFLRSRRQSAPAAPASPPSGSRQRRKPQVFRPRIPHPVMGIAMYVILHPGRPADGSVLAYPYASRCRIGLAQVLAQVVINLLLKLFFVGNLLAHIRVPFQMLLQRRVCLA